MIFIRQVLSRIPPQLLLLLLAILGYWQIALLHNSLKWDALDVVLPWRYYVSEALQNNYLPLWNSYQQMGYPLYADLQYPFWYIEQLIIGYTLGYNNYTLHFLFIFYVWMGGCGIYRLTSFLKVGKHWSFYAGTVYMLSGFMVGHVQSFTLIVGAAWVPHVVVQYLKLLKSNSLRHLPSTALFMFLLITGGYQAFTILTCYLLLAFFISESIMHIKSKRIKTFLQSLKLNFFLLVVVVVLSSFIFVLLYQLSPYTNRLQGLPMEFANFNPLSPQCLISLLLPFSIVKENAFFGTDISMTNTYMGLTALVLVFASLFRKKTTEEKVFLIFGSICLLASMGEYTPVREFLFYYFPLLNLFRFPSIISYFTLLAFMPVAAKHLQLFYSVGLSRKSTMVAAVIVFLSLLVLLIYSFIQISITDFGFKNIFHDFYGVLESSGIYEHIFVQSIIQLLTFSVIIYALYKNKQKLFLLFVCFEMILSVQFNIYYTGVSYVEPKDIKQALENLPEGFPVPAMRAIERNSDAASAIYGLNRNTNIFRKQISYDGYTSFWLKQYDQLFADNPELKDAVLKNPCFYFSGNLRPLSELSVDTVTGFSSKDLFVNDSIYEKYKDDELKHHEGTCSQEVLDPVLFTPGEIMVRTVAPYKSVLTLLQSNYYGWKVYIDNKPAKHFTSNFLFMSVVVPEGHHEIKYIYSNKPFVYAMALSYSVGILLLLWLIGRYYRANRVIGKYLLIGLIFVSAAVVSLLIFRYGKDPSAKNKESLDNMLQELFRTMEKLPVKNTAIVLNTDNWKQVLDQCHEKIGSNSLFINDLWDNNDKADLIRTVEQNNTPYFILAWNNNLIPDDVKYIIQSKYHSIENSWEYDNSGVILFSNTGKDSAKYVSTNDFEKEYEYWSYDPQYGNPEKCLSGIKSYKLDSLHEYSPAFNAALDAISAERKFNLFVSAKFAAHEVEGAVLVIAIQSGEKMKEWITVPVTDFFKNAHQWNKITYVKQIGWIGKEDKISIYVWNREKKTIYLDDMEVRLYNFNGGL